jgi:hypothetical protein
VRLRSSTALRYTLQMCGTEAKREKRAWLPRLAEALLDEIGMKVLSCLEVFCHTLIASLGA